MPSRVDPNATDPFVQRVLDEYGDGYVRALSIIFAERLLLDAADLIDLGKPIPEPLASYLVTAFRRIHAPMRGRELQRAAAKRRRIPIVTANEALHLAQPDHKPTFAFRDAYIVTVYDYLREKLQKKPHIARRFIVNAFGVSEATARKVVSSRNRKRLCVPWFSETYKEASIDEQKKMQWEFQIRMAEAGF